MGSPHDDRALLRQLRCGDRGAFEELYRATKDDLWSAVSRMLGDRGEAEDVLHDVYLELVRKAGSIELRGSLRGYLLRSCWNRVTDLRRKRGAESRRAAALAPRGAQGEEDSDPSIRLLRAEEARRAGAELEALPCEQREVVLLRLFGPWKFREIASQLAVPLDTVQSRYRTALATLRRRLDVQRTGDVS